MITIFERNMLTVPNGHLTTIERALAELAPTTDFKFIVSGGETADSFPKDEKKWPIVSTIKEIKHDPVSSYEKDYHNLSVYLDLTQTGPYAPVLFPSAELLDMRFIVKYAEKFGDRCKFYLRILTARYIKSLEKHEFETLKKHIKDGTVVLLTETDSLSLAFERDEGVSNVQVLLLPCTFSSNNFYKEETNLIPRLFRIGHMGSLRKDKGFALVPDVLTALSKTMKDQNPDFQIHYKLGTIWRKILKPWILIFEMRLLARSLFNKVTGEALQIERLPVMHNLHDFAALFDEIDIVILPYDQQRYLNSGSGIIIDAVMKGKPIVYVNGMGMTEFLNSGNAEPAEGSHEFASKLMKVMQEFEQYSSGAKVAQKQLKHRLKCSTELLRQIDQA